MARIVLAEDDGLQADLLRMDLALAGHEVETCADGEALMVALAAGGTDLVVTDIAMPNVDGLAALETLRADDAHAHVPIIVITALPQTTYVLEALRGGADDFVRKPIAPGLLPQRVEQALAGYPGSRTMPAG
ncbi:response regulator transcription factor [Paraurantiacibacter namhicola]|uniref:Chemotaxis protein CheY n=1 Tax=Paraurantiacibacter namhicola TaxID=645517 RepID=A0A1C7D6Y6_9SPHN|nr:response regulator [Paraurantiacibacter namhicola]ANU07112.1 Chemotaxis protein CheY [Paraurantiacibacter namhicola]